MDHVAADLDLERLADEHNALAERRDLGGSLALTPEERTRLAELDAALQAAGAPMVCLVVIDGGYRAEVWAHAGTARP